MSDELDKAERRAIEMVEFFQEECRKQCAPYLEIIANIRNVRPRTYIIDSDLMVPIDSAPPTVPGSSTSPPPAP
jgi:hypothetical protein